MKINPNKNYMNPKTGSVAIGQEWLDDQKRDGWPIGQLDTLIEVTNGYLNERGKKRISKLLFDAEILKEEESEGFLEGLFEEISLKDLDFVNSDPHYEIGSFFTPNRIPFVIDLEKDDFDWIEVE